MIVVVCISRECARHTTVLAIVLCKLRIARSLHFSAEFPPGTLHEVLADIAFCSRECRFSHPTASMRITFMPSHAGHLIEPEELFRRLPIDQHIEHLHLQRSSHGLAQATNGKRRSNRSNKKGAVAPQAAKGQYGQEAAMKVSEVMTRDVRVANPEDTLRQAAQTMASLDAGVLPVGEQDH